MSESPPFEDQAKRPRSLALVSFVFGWIGILFGAAGIPGIALLAMGGVALVAGFLALEKAMRKPLACWDVWVTAGAGTILGGFCLMVGLLEPSFQTHAITRAMKLTSLATVVALESSINALYTEYGVIPNVGRRVTTESPEGRKLLAILLGLEEKSDKPLNSRAIKFLSVKEGKANRNGLIYNTTENAVEGLYDPWGSPYTVELDVEYKEQLHFTIGSKAVDLIGRRVAVYSPGPDKKLGTADDVKNW